jgi:hypothetical protein
MQASSSEQIDATPYEWLPEEALCLAERNLAMGTRLYVGNLPYDASELTIREFFEQSGSRQVSQIKIICDRNS